MSNSLSTPITVLLPVYNASAFLKEAIESILNQTFRDFELLIINDGSTDDSENIILRFGDPRIRYIKNEKNLRLIATLNKGIELSSGKYIARMDADDISLPERLQIQYDFMEQNPEVALCGSWYEAIGSRERLVKYVSGHQPIMLKMLYQCHLCHPSVMIRKRSLDNFSPKFESSFLHAEDYEFFTRIGETYQLDNIQRVLLKYRLHESSVSISNKQIQDDNSIRVKQHLFQKIGLNVSKEELEIFRKISEHNYERTKPFLEQSKQLLENMIEANETSQFFEPQFLRKSLSAFWFHTCYNATNLGWHSLRTYYQSSLVKHHNPGGFYKFKFIIKALFKL